MNIEAVIFDLDGLMVDSERYHYVVMEQLLAKYGKCALEGWLEALIGMDNLETAEFIIRETNLHLSPEEYLQETYEMLLLQTPEVAQPIPGLLALIQNFQAADFKLGVASNSFGVYVRSVVEALGIYDVFDCVLSSDDVVNAKPAPEIYLLASQRLGVPPERCLVLEDSYHGMMAALEAGMSCVVIPNPHLRTADFSQATFVFSSLEELNASLPEIIPDGKG